MIIHPVAAADAFHKTLWLGAPVQNNAGMATDSGTQELERLVCVYLRVCCNLPVQEWEDPVQTVCEPEVANALKVLMVTEQSS